MIYSILLFLFHFSVTVELKDRWLIELKSKDSQCLDDWWITNGLDKTHFLKKKLPIDNWMVVEIPTRNSNSLSKLPCIQQILVNQKLENRNTIPNDPDYIEQNDMELIGMPAAWDISTGGLTAKGDTIVVATIDDGFQTDHEDLIENLWHNRNEIPNDGIDNDHNGYIDDYTGVNITTGRDNHPVLHHGTSVSGIMGAKGNNVKGTCGVNWNVKIMLISYNHNVSELVEGYQYILDMRKRYRETKGKEGAFVVAVNLSSGIDYAVPKNWPIWCSMYDKLGEEGILSICSGPNNNHNVDREGDMPTRCISPYMITVTNISPSDVIVDNAGYGRISIDLGAPGENSLTTDISNSYNFFSGTSAAAPHVAGTVALMYSTPCASFLDGVGSDPASVATRVKNIILSSATFNKSLQGITLTGKRLQTDAALRATLAQCENKIEQEISIRFIAPNPVGTDFTKIYFEVSGDTSSASLDIYSLNGTLVNTFPISQEEFLQGYIAFDTRPFAGGLYLLTLRNKKSFTTAKLFIE